MNRKSVNRLVYVVPTIAMALVLSTQYPPGFQLIGVAAAQGALEEIVVTARKRSESLADVPDSIVVITSDQIERAGITTVKDIGMLYPNIGSRNDLSPTSTFISVRGITQTRNTDPAISIVVDGVQISNASQVRQELFDIEQIEILKGPQGSLYGRNAIAGAINITTKAPTNEHQGKFTVGYGNADALDLRFSVAGPVIKDTLSYRLAGTYHDDDGTINNATVNKKADFQENKTLRARLSWFPTENFNADFRFSVDDLEAGNYNYVITRPIGVPFTGRIRNSNNGFGRPTSDPISVAFGTIWDTSLKLEYDFGWAKLSSVTAYNNTYERYGRRGEGVGGDGPGDLDFVAGEFIGNEQTYTAKSWSEEAKLISNTEERLRWMVGLYYISIDRRDTLPVFIDFDGDGDLADETFIISPVGLKRNIDAIAVFGNLDFDITDKWTVSLGLRYDREDRDQFDYDDPDPTTNFFDKIFDDIQPKASISYNATGDHMFYLTASRGFRSGGFNTPRSAFPTTFKEETLWSYELGHKGRYAGGAMLFNAAVFYEDINDKQDFVFDSVQAAQILHNIPESSVWGIELDGTWAVSDRLTVGAALGWMDSEIEAFENAALFPINVGGNAAAISAASGLATPISDNFFIGNKLGNFSHWSASVTGEYRWPITNTGWEASLHIDYAVRGDNYWDVFNTDIEEDVHLINANVAVENENWQLTVWAKNLGNTQYWSNWFNAQTTNLPDVGYQATERRYGVTLSYRF